MTLVAFSKLAKIKTLKNKVQKVQLELLYRKVARDRGVSLMSLEIFFDAMEELALMIYPVDRNRFDLLLDLVLENIEDTMPSAAGKK